MSGRYVAECPLPESYPDVAYVKDRIHGAWISGPMDTPDAETLARRWSRLTRNNTEDDR